MSTILVAEDDAPVRALIHRILTHEGFEVVCPPNRSMALEVVAAHPGGIDLIVADVSDGGIDDSQTLEDFEAPRADPAVLFLASAGGPPVHAGNWVTKPFRPAALVQKVKGLLRRRSSGRSEGIATVRRETSRTQGAWEPSPALRRA